ncbi:SPX domain-containing protein [Melampsora americana]|nr:SPX domain-containing protein [Melampsora americana]
MKFGKTYDQTIRSGPEQWTQSAIGYKSLKKLIRLLSEELQASGLTRSVLTTLLDSSDLSVINDPEQLRATLPFQIHSLVISTNKTSSSTFQPVCLQIGTRKAQWVHVLKASYELDGHPINEPISIESCTENKLIQEEVVISSNPQSSNETQILIPLKHDGKFFQELQSALILIESFYKSEHEFLSNQLETFYQQLSKSINSSNKNSIRRLYQWRPIISLYYQLQIFNHCQGIEERWEKFIESDVCERADQDLEIFIDLNHRLIKLKKYSEMNSEAIRKLLKKHSKRTSLPNVIQFLNLSSRVTGHDQHLIKVLSERLVEVVPILENYECPICREIAYKPVKMNCGHRFCVRCLVKLQKSSEDRCAVCRKCVVLHTTPRALEVETKVYMERWFPKEIKLKTKDDAKELAIEELNELGLPVLKSGCVIN